MKDCISVCMSTYNGERHIFNQLKSIVEQDIQPDEIIIVDDASSDKTVQIIKSFVKHHSNIKLYVNDQNFGVNYSFAKAIRLTKNNIIIFSDQDDFWYASRLKAIRNKFRENSDLEMVLTNAHVYMNEEYTGLTTFDFYNPTKSFVKVFYKNCFIGCQMAIKKTMMPSFINFPKYTFYDHFIALFFLINGKQVDFIDEVHSKYIRHDGNLTNLKVSSSLLEGIFSRIFIMLYLIKIAINRPKTRSEYE